MLITFLIFVTIFICAFAYSIHQERRFQQGKMSPDEADAYADRKNRALQQQYSHSYGHPNPALVCPHCQEKGRVRTKSVQLKKGISGGKATAAVITGGVSVLATGLSRKENITQAHCDHCHSTWNF